MREQSSGILLENSAETVGSRGGSHCPSKKRHLLDLSREVQPSEEGPVDLSQSLGGSPWQLWLLQPKMQEKKGLLKKPPKGLSCRGGLQSWGTCTIQLPAPPTERPESRIPSPPQLQLQWAHLLADSGQPPLKSPPWAPGWSDTGPLSQVLVQEPSKLRRTASPLDVKASGQPSWLWAV